MLTQLGEHLLPKIPLDLLTSTEYSYIVMRIWACGVMAAARDFLPVHTEMSVSFKIPGPLTVVPVQVRPRPPFLKGVKTSGKNPA
jgi:hypothetical protein